jgi:hypothetical protein
MVDDVPSRTDLQARHCDALHSLDVLHACALQNLQRHVMPTGFAGTATSVLAGMLQNKLLVQS